MTDHIWLVRSNDPLNHEIDVFTDYDLACDVADAQDGYVEEQPILKRDDEYVLYSLSEHEDAQFTCDACGRVGNHDDGINHHGDECPDEECDGHVQLILEGDKR